MSNPNKRTRRSPLEILTARQEEMNRLSAKVAEKALADHPVIQKINGALAAVAEDLIEAQRLFSKGPQNLEMRRKSHVLWMAELDAAEAHALQVIAWAAKAKEDLKEAREKAIADLVAQKPNEAAGEVDAAIELVNTLPSSLLDASDVLNRMTNARKSFTAAKGPGTKASPDTTAEALESF